MEKSCRDFSIAPDLCDLFGKKKIWWVFQPNAALLAKSFYIFKGNDS
jgi:hypothetical protein